MMTKFLPTFALVLLLLSWKLHMGVLSFLTESSQRHGPFGLLAARPPAPAPSSPSVLVKKTGGGSAIGMTAAGHASSNTTMTSETTEEETTPPAQPKQGYRPIEEWNDELDTSAETNVLMRLKQEKATWKKTFGT